MVLLWNRKMMYDEPGAGSDPAEEVTPELASNEAETISAIIDDPSGTNGLSTINVVNALSDKGYCNGMITETYHDFTPSFLNKEEEEPEPDPEPTPDHSE